MKAIKVIGAVVAGLLLLALVGAFGFGMEILGIKASGITQPMREQVRADVYDNSQTRINGTRKALANYAMEYAGTDNPAHRKAICSAATAEALNVDESKLRRDNIDFLNECGR